MGTPVLPAARPTHNNMSGMGRRIEEQKCYLANEGNNAAIIACLSSSANWRVNAKTALTCESGVCYYKPPEEPLPNERTPLDIGFMFVVVAVAVYFAFLHDSRKETL